MAAKKMSFECQPFDTELTLKKGNTTMRVMPERCLITGFKVDDWEVLYRAEKTHNLMRAGLPLMIPNFSSLRLDKEGKKTFIETGTQLPHHGFGRNTIWNVDQPTEDSVSCWIEDTTETREMYPFKFKFTMRATVLGNGKIKHETIMENREEGKTLPVQPGLHPYISCPQADKQNIEVNFTDFNAKDWQWLTKENTPDNSVAFDKTASITFPSTGTLIFTEEPVDGKYSYKIMQIWSEQVTAKDIDFVCFEPVVWGADGLNDPKTRLNIPPKSTQTITMILEAIPKKN